VKQNLARLQTVILLSAVLFLVVNLAGRTFAYDGDQHKSARSGHGTAKRQHLERDSASWSIPLAVFVPPLWPEVSAHVATASEPVVPTCVDSCLYNRPPPSVLI